MPVAGRTLLIVNRSAGTGHGQAIVDRLGGMLAGLTDEVRVEVVEDHPTARESANEFLWASGAPAVVVAGGGSGTILIVELTVI